MPSYLGAYDQITGTLDINCPDGGCDDWDRVSSIDVKGHNGKWVEIIRYITPYGVPCDHSIDLTDYMSLLQGKVTFRINYVTFGNGFEYNLRLDYQAGSPEYNYSNVDVVWQKTYNFGDLANLQPVENVTVTYPDDAIASTLKLVSTGHGWGDNNTGNAAEFHEDTHHIWVNGTETFEQHNWAICNPNPDGCQPQNGTWTFNRAGWCPGAIAPWFNYDMTDFLSDGVAELQYRFDEDYVDFCHPNNPDCVTNAQCDCEDGFNPHLIVACNLVTFSDVPLEEVNEIIPDTTDTSLDELWAKQAFHLYPNPSKEVAYLQTHKAFQDLQINVLNNQGKNVLSFTRSNVLVNERQMIDVQSLAKGVYLIEIITEQGKTSRKLVVE